MPHFLHYMLGMQRAYNNLQILKPPLEVLSCHMPKDQKLGFLSYCKDRMDPVKMIIISFSWVRFILFNIADFI